MHHPPGHEEFLAKPFATPALISAVQHLLEG